MKRFAKVMSLVLAMCILLGSFGTVSFAADFPDVANGASYYPAVSLLTSLGIIKGYEDGTFGPDRNVTRAEFTVMLMRAMANSGVASNDLNGIPFKDLEPVKEWAAGDIKTAYSLGIINGMDENTFAPDDQVTYEQALKMIVCAIGYEPVALEAVGNDASKVWPEGYLAAASNTKLDNGITVVVEQPAKRWEIARMLYNAFDVEMLEKYTYADGTVGYRKTNKTLLSDKLKIRYSVGEIRANEKESIEAGRVVRAGEVLIRNNDTNALELVYAGNVSTEGLVGRTVKFYYKEDADYNKTLVHLELRKDSALSIDVSSIDQVYGDYGSGFTIEYFANADDRRTTKAEIPARPTVSINGRAVNSVTADDLFPEVGSLTLIDSENDGNYEKVSVLSYDTYVASYVNTTDRTITDLYRGENQNKIKLVDVEDSNLIVNITDTNGAKLSLSSIKKWNVLSIKENTSTTSKNSIDVIVSNNSVNGSITAIHSDGVIEINNKEYEYSKYFETYGVNEFGQGLEKIVLGDSGNFYLDKDGRIAAFDKSDPVNNNYGYLAGVSMNSMRDKVLYTLMKQSANSTPQTVNGAEHIRIDGEVMSDPDKIVDYLNEISEKYANSTGAVGSYINVDGNQSDGSMLIRYTLNSSGAISVIDTVEPKGSLEAYSKNSNAIWKYAKTNEFTDKNGNKIRINSSTYIAFVPVGSRKNLDDYRVAKLAGTTFDTSMEYTLEAFDVDETNLAKAIVVYGGSAESKITRETPVALITNVTGRKNSDGENVQAVTAYIIGSGSGQTGNEETTIYTEAANEPGIAVGNVIRYATTSKGAIKHNSVQVLVDVGEDGIQPFTTDANNNPFKDTDGKFIDYNGAYGTGGYSYKIARGLLNYATDDTPQFISVIPVGTRTEEAVEEAKADEYSFSVESVTRFFTYDASQADSAKVTKNDNDLRLGGYASCTISGAEAAQEVFVFEANARVRLIYIIKR